MARKIYNITLNSVTAVLVVPGGHGDIDFYNASAIDVRIGTSAEVLASGGRTIKAGRTYQDYSGNTDAWYGMSASATPALNAVDYKD